MLMMLLGQQQIGHLQTTTLMHNKISALIVAQRGLKNTLQKRAS